MDPSHFADMKNKPPQPFLDIHYVMVNPEYLFYKHTVCGTPVEQTIKMMQEKGAFDNELYVSWETQKETVIAQYKKLMEEHKEVSRKGMENKFG